MANLKLIFESLSSIPDGLLDDSLISRLNCGVVSPSVVVREGIPVELMKADWDIGGVSISKSLVTGFDVR